MKNKAKEKINAIYGHGHPIQDDWKNEIADLMVDFADQINTVRIDGDMNILEEPEKYTYWKRMQGGVSNSENKECGIYHRAEEVTYKDLAERYWKETGKWETEYEDMFDQFELQIKSLKEKMKKHVAKN